MTDYSVVHSSNQVEERFILIFHYSLLSIHWYPCQANSSVALLFHNKLNRIHSLHVCRSFSGYREKADCTVLHPLTKCCDDFELFNYVSFKCVMLKQVEYCRLKCRLFVVLVGLCSAIACNVVVKVKWCCTSCPQSTTSSGVDWTDCWWIAVQWQRVHTLWGMFAIRATSETDGLLIGHTGHRGHPGSMKQTGVHTFSRIRKTAVWLLYQALSVSLFVFLCVCVC